MDCWALEGVTDDYGHLDERGFLGIKKNSKVDIVRNTFLVALFLFAAVQSFLCSWWPLLLNTQLQQYSLFLVIFNWSLFPSWPL
jgi:hypothetical protein